MRSKNRTFKFTHNSEENANFDLFKGVNLLIKLTIKNNETFKLNPHHVKKTTHAKIIL